MPKSQQERTKPSREGKRELKVEEYKTEKSIHIESREKGSGKVENRRKRDFLANTNG
jgi:hypothetical protein